MWPVMAMTALMPVFVAVSAWWASRAGGGGFLAIGEILIGLLAVVVVGALGYAMHRRLRPLEAVRDAMQALCEGEPSTGALVVDPRLGPIADAWNSHLLRIEQTRGDLAVQSVETRMAPAIGPASGLERGVDVMWQGVMAIDAGRHVTYANGAACALLGHKLEDLISRPAETVLDDDNLRRTVSDASSGAGPARATMEIRRTGADQEHVLRYTVCRCAKPAGGNAPRGVGAIAAIVVIEDLTQQREADRVRDAFITQTVHELRTPLTNIRLYVERATDDGQNDAHVMGECLNAINQESRRLERIVGDMLSVSEIEAGQWKLTRGDVRLDALFEELRLGHEASAREKDITLTFELPPKLPVVMADRDKLLLAMHNIVGNAIKYTLQGGSVTVVASVDGPAKGKGTRKDAGGESNLTVSVRDTGIGIAPHELDRIFERFHRAEDSRVANVTGTGLGLTLARDVIRMHGGDVTVQSQLNRGTTFTISLPAPAVPTTVGGVGDVGAAGTKKAAA